LCVRGLRPPAGGRRRDTVGGSRRDPDGRGRSRSVTRLSPHDAILVVSFGGPGGPDDVVPFLERVTRGRGVPAARLETTAGDYEAQLREASALVAERLPVPLPWDRAYQSRSGPPAQPWLEPDVHQHLEAVAAAGVSDVVLVPLGFVSDHMEVAYDLDVEARQ